MVFLCPRDGSILGAYRRAVSKGFLAGYKITNRNGEEEKITHLLFAHDTLVFYRDSREEMVNLSWVQSHFWIENQFGEKLCYACGLGGGFRGFGL